MKKTISFMAGITWIFIAATALTLNGAQSQPEDSTQAVVDTAVVPQNNQVIIYYLHMNRRCATCEKLEAYSREAIETGFDKQLKDGMIVFRVENFEKEGNEHFAEDYQLYSQSLILSRLLNGQETEWENLDKIWTLVGDKEKFISYVQTEVGRFVNTEQEQ